MMQDLLVSSTGSDSVLCYDGTRGRFRGSFVPQGSGGLQRPQGLCFGPDGNLYVSSFGTGQVLRYRHGEQEIDSYLRLEDATGKELAKDDDSGGLVNARINFQCRKDGEHRVICTTFAGGTGPFTLTIQEIALAKAVELTLKDGLAKVESKLTGTDPTDAVQTRSVCKIYAIKLAKGKTYQIDMMSKDIDSFLRLEDASGKELATAIA